IFVFQAEDGIRDFHVTGVQTCALPICFWSDAPQGPKNHMNNSVTRKKEMAWMKSIGVKGIKVDFFGGDKQETMKLYEEILSDARSEERRVGKEWRRRWAAYPESSNRWP